MDDDQQFCLRWNNHQSTLISVIDTLLENGKLVDCTLAAEGQFLKAHKVVLSACSPYFATLLSQQYDKHPIFILKDVKFQELRAMMDYMYRGEVNISQDQLAALLKAAESLQIKGLSDSRSGGNNNNNGSTQSATAASTGAGSLGGGIGGGGNNINKDSISGGTANKHASVPTKGSGLTIEQKRSRTDKHQGEDMSESREGSTSPNARKRKKIRRRSIETNNVDNHDQHSNSSSHSITQQQQQTAAIQQQQQASTTTITSATTTSSSAAVTTASVAGATMPVAGAMSSSANVLNVTKKTDSQQQQQKDVAELEADEQQQQQHKVVDQRQNNGGRKSISSSVSRANKEHQDLIEPKNEFEESNEETVEDLTLDEEELMEDLDQAGPSHGGEGSSQGYPQWQIDRSQDNEAFISGQDASGQHRDAQEELTCTPMIYNMNDSSAAGSGHHSDRELGGDGTGGDGQRFFCTVCDKSYLRKRHLQRHMRDECIGIPPRFQCTMCTSKFRRKYHLVRHLNSKHAVVVTKDNELDMIQKKSGALGSVGSGMGAGGESMDDSDYLMKQEKLFTENNFLNNEIFSRAMNLMMPKLETNNSKVLPIIDTNQLLETMKQQQQSFLAAAAGGGGRDSNGIEHRIGAGSGAAPILPLNILQQMNEDQDMYNRFLGFDKMAVNAMMRKQYDLDTDCDSDDVQDLRTTTGTNGRGGGNGSGGGHLSDSEETDGKDGMMNVTKTSDDFQMKMNIELRPDFVGHQNRLHSDTNAPKSQIGIPNDSLN